GRRLRDTLGQALGRLVGEEPELVGIDALPPGTILAAEQLLDLVLELLDPPLGLLDGGGLLADDLLAEVQVGGQGRVGLAHAPIVAAHITSKRASTGNSMRVVAGSAVAAGRCPDQLRRGSSSGPPP